MSAMNTMSLFCGRVGERSGALEHRLPRSGADEVARGPITATACAAPWTIHRGQKSAGPIRIGMSLTDRDQTGRGGQWGFVAVLLRGPCSVRGLFQNRLAVTRPGWSRAPAPGGGR